MTARNVMPKSVWMTVFSHMSNGQRTEIPGFVDGFTPTFADHPLHRLRCAWDWPIPEGALEEASVSKMV